MGHAEEILKTMTTRQKIAQLQCLMSLGEAVGTEACPDGAGEVSLMPIMMQPREVAEAVDTTIRNAC